MANHDEVCAALCLLTRIAWEDGLPSVMTRLMVHRMKEAGALHGFEALSVPGIASDLLERARVLLSRAESVRKAMDVYRAQGYVILTPQDESWPKRLERLPVSQRPHVLFAMGNMSLLGSKTAALAGSREIQPYTASLARRAGQLMAAEGVVMVSGGARGVDTSAHMGLFELGGRLILVPAKPVHQLLARKELVCALEEGRLLVLCDALPDEPFSSSKALARNHTIYALGEAALVVAARDGVGGSWRGATDCLRGGYTPLFAAKGTSPDMLGNAVLHRLGAGQVDLLKPLAGQLFAPAAKQMGLFSETDDMNRIGEGSHADQA